MDDVIIIKHNGKSGKEYSLGLLINGDVHELASTYYVECGDTLVSRHNTFKSYNQASYAQNEILKNREQAVKRGEYDAF